MRILFFLLLSASFLLNSFSETVNLKNGGQVKVNILKTTSAYIKGESDGEPVIYFFDEISSIDAESSSSTSVYNEKLADSALLAYDIDSLANWLRERLCYYVMKYDNRLDQSMTASVKSIIYNSYDTKAFYAIAKSAFDQHFDREKLYNVNKYLHAPGVMAVIEARKKLNAGDYTERWQLFKEQADLGNFNPTRLDLVDELDKANMLSSFTYDFISAALLTIASNQQINKNDLINDTRQDVRNIFYFLFQDSSDSALEAHARLAANKDMRWFEYWLRSAVLEANLMFSNVAAKRIDEYVMSVKADMEAKKSKKEIAKEKAAKTAEEKRLKLKEAKEKARKKHSNKILDADKNTNKSNLVPASWVHEE